MKTSPKCDIPRRLIVYMAQSYGCGAHLLYPTSGGSQNPSVIIFLSLGPHPGNKSQPPTAPYTTPHGASRFLRIDDTGHNWASAL